MKSFIVSLPESVERRNIVIDKAESAGIEYQIFDAIRGSSLSEAELDHSVYKYQESYLAKGEIGCALSHLKIYKQMIDENIPYALILEDDADFGNDIADVLLQLENVNNFLNSSDPVLVILNDTIGRYSPFNKIALDNNRNLYKSYGSFLSSSYIINLSAAKNLFELLYPVKFEIDRWGLYTACGAIKLYKLMPHIVQTNFDDSTITDRNNDSYMFKKQKIKDLIKEFPLRIRVNILLYKICLALNPVVKKSKHDRY